MDYSLAVNRYVKRKETPILPLEEAYTTFVAAFQNMEEQESRLEKRLLDGGYINE